MSSFEIKPGALNPATVVLGIASLAITAIMAFSVYPNFGMLNSYAIGEGYSVDLVYVLLSTAIFIPWLILLLMVVSIRSKIIVVAGNLVYFNKKTFFGFGHWISEKVLDLSKVVSINDKKKTTFIYTGNALIPVVMYWVVFETADQQKQEILLNTWDIASIKNLFYFIRGKYSDIKINTVILRDSSEKMAGIDKLIKS